MKKLLFVCYPKCTTCKKAQAFLDEGPSPYLFRDIKEENPTADELREWWEKSGLPLKRFWNTSGMQYRALKIKDKLADGMSEEDQLSLMATDGMLVKRPILIGEHKGATFVLTGFRGDEWKEALGRE